MISSTQSPGLGSLGGPIFLLKAVGCLLFIFGSSLATHSAEPTEADDAVTATLPVPVPKLTGMLHNEDCTNLFAHQRFPDGKAGETVDRYVDVIAESGVGILVCNTSSRRTNYRSDVWEAFWDGYDPEGPDDQAFFAAVPEEQRGSYRQLIANMLATHNEGVDYPARVVERCRHHGMSPWISLRMNDVHANGNLDHPIHSDFWRNARFFREGHPGYYARALDYAHAEVRNHYRALIVETLERYDIDGLELDFMREPYLFSKGGEQEGRLILNDWLRDIRTLVDDAAKHRGHAVKLGVRVPSSPQTALGLGLDAPTWAKEGLVDLVVATPRWSTVDFDIPIGQWRELLGDRVTLAGGLEVNYQPYLGIPNRIVTQEEAVGAAIGVWASGADTVYLFNFFQDNHPRWPIPEYHRMLRAFSSFEELQKLPRRHAVTFEDVTLPGEKYPSLLPAIGDDFDFSMQLGPAPPANWQGQVVIEIELAATDQQNAEPNLSVNGVAATLQSSDAMPNGHRLLSYSFPTKALSGSNRDTIKHRDNVAITAAGERPVTVHRVEVSLRPKDSKPAQKP